MDKQIPTNTLAEYHSLREAIKKELILEGWVLKAEATNKTFEITERPHDAVRYIVKDKRSENYGKAYWAVRKSTKGFSYFEWE